MSFTPAWPKGRIVKIAARGNQPSINLTVHETGTGPAVVFCHGFPELAYSWRHQLPAVAAAGFARSRPISAAMRIRVRRPRSPTTDLPS